ncbi:phosphoglycerate kinase [Candidatus Woesearchaeota archaeon]|nr:phosphoglycerate kinase [Candidatus Woesearchaeota archaeon]
MRRFLLTELPLQGKKVFLRVDFNVPIKEGTVTDDRKIRAVLPTLSYLLEKGCTIILATHLGRPEGKMVENLRTAPLANVLQELLPKETVTPLYDCIGKEVRERVTTGRAKTVFVLENVRFYKEEEENDLTFAHALADLAEFYVNDAFGEHGRHASVDAITQFLPSAAGFLVEREILQLSKALQPERPAVWLMGGAKLDKVDLIKQALKKADYILIGGALAFSFLRAKGYAVGHSKTDQESIATAKKILKNRGADKIILPLDFVAADAFSQNAKTEIVPYGEIPAEKICLDLGPRTIEEFKKYLRQARTIVWNGPLGYFEWVKFATATREIARFISALTATRICGGGETAEAIQRYHLEDKMTHVSTGGGAALLYLSGKKIPAITALEKNYLKFRKKVKPVKFSGFSLDDDHNSPL